MSSAWMMPASLSTAKLRFPLVANWKSPLLGCSSLLGSGDTSSGSGFAHAAELVDDDELGAQQVLDDAADTVVGQAAVERLDELGGGEVADPEAGVDRGVAESYEDVALASAGRADQADVLGGAEPLQGCQVVERRAWDRRRGDVEGLEGLGDREGGGLEPGAGVGRVAGRDLGVDERAEQLLRRPPLRLGGDEQFGGELAHGRELEPPQPRGQVRRQRRSVALTRVPRARRRPAVG